MIKPVVVLFGTVVTYLILQSLDKSKNDETKTKTKMKIIMTKVSLFLIIFIIFIALVYCFDITSIFNLKNISFMGMGGKKVDKIDIEMEEVPMNLLKQNYAEIETIKKIRENIHVGLTPDNMSIGEISRK